MEGHMCLLFVVFGVSVLGPWVSGSVVDVMVKPGDNITLLCDCTCSTGVYTVWYRNCSHTNQPTLVLKTWKDRLYPIDQNYISKLNNPLPGFKFVKDSRSKCYNLHITNITENDGGSYYCGTKTTEVLDSDKLTLEFVYNYGNTTRILLIAETSDGHRALCTASWPGWLMSVSVLLLCNIGLILMYHVCREKDVYHPVQGNQTAAFQIADLNFTRVVFRTKDTKTH
ncbi:uncharacterized protein LOC117379019 [Periophthalmus magnuspinnatus]|uniref:uncharacterized protein LOC117379019 n=1 Tax=Periophthalmus magnuspinnatus TaxID=409849 RepID=UPI00243701E4|nr:uncharacterized protein LOC117379019 [Periophthalmus magnuspinnatus]